MIIIYQILMCLSNLLRIIRYNCSITSYLQIFIQISCKKINRICQENDSIVIWDLSHAIGAIDIDMKVNDIDYAIGCTYKYLNGGPGSPAFIYARNEKQIGLKSPIKGWFSHSDPFNFSKTYIQSESMSKFSSGTPHIISMSTLILL